MSIDDQIKALEQKVEGLLRDDPGIFLVEIRIKPTNNVKVFVDGDTGVSIDKLVQYNRKLYRDLDENGFFPGGDFSLEVSSPGLDEPLKLKRQYLKNIGRYVEVIKMDGSVKEGNLISASEAEIVLEEEKGKKKKKEVLVHTIPLLEIKATRIQIKF